MFLTSQPDDQPAQFYSRQIIYESLFRLCKPSDVPDSTASSHLHVDHSYTTVDSSGPGTHNTSIHISIDQPRILFINPCMWDPYIIHIT